jgi:hypothetical protein
MLEVERLCWRGRGMRKQDGGYDYHRYRQLLAEADDEDKRLALIELLIEEKARDRLATERASDRAAMTAMTVAKVLGSSRADPAPYDGAARRGSLR